MNGNYLKYLIYNKGYNINEIADKINIAPQTITNWINGRNTSNIDKILEIFILLEIDKEDLKILENK